MTRLKSLAVAAVLIASTVAGLAPGASANDTAAFIGGLAAGTFIGGAVAGGRPGPVMVGPPVYYQRHCWWEQRPIFNQFNQVIGSQPVQICR